MIINKIIRKKDEARRRGGYMEMEINRKTGRAVRVCVFISVGVALIALLGWILKVSVFASLSSKYIPMAPLTALLFIFLDGVFIIHLYFPKVRFKNILNKFVILLAIIISLDVLCKHFFGISIDIEQFFYNASGSLGKIPLGRMSTIAAGLFLLSCFSLWLLLNRGSLRVTAIYAAVVFLAGVFIFLGYAYKEPLFYGGTVIPVALTTAFSFIFLNLAILIAVSSFVRPLKLLTGDSMTAYLLRIFLPVMVIMIFLVDWVDDIILVPLGTSHALWSAVSMFFVLIVAAITIFFISKYVSYLLDKSKRRLDEIQERYRILVEQVPTVSYITALDEASTIIYISPQIKKLTGYTAEECMSDSDTWRKMVNPEDIEWAMGEIKRARKSGQPLAIEYRMTTKDKKTIWVHDEAQIVKDAEGNPISRQGTMYDITKQKDSEIQLKKKIDEMETFYKITIGREKRIIELKEELGKMSEEMGKK